MRKAIKLILGIAVLVFAISCDSKTGKTHGNNGAEQTDEHQKEQPATKQTDEHAGDEVLQLNNGNLWEANLETTEGINNMKLLIKSFSERDNMVAYATVKQNLEKEFGTIIAKCTMTGEAHNQLHKYLVPMKDLFDGLAASDLDTRKYSLNKINTHIEGYIKYFK
ncbi:MAG: hypothetical protein COB01_08830 [Lutibacter sp.]|nr:MAG: hypothetical protein COB01_08830 [Lutibacter sp.]